jgi:hypothetical protein
MVGLNLSNILIKINICFHYDSNEFVHNVRIL